MAHAFKRFLVPVDFNVPSRIALTLAGDLATVSGATIDVIHVIDLPFDTHVVSEGHVPIPAEYRRAVDQQASDRLKAWLATTATSGTMSPHVLEGKPAAEIVRYADDQKIDLIVMGTHGRGGLSAFLTGSVTDNVIRAAHCPVMAVRGT